MLKKSALAAILSLSSLHAYHTIELNLNNLDLGVNLDLDMGQFNDNVDPDTTFIGASYLRVDKKNSAEPKSLQRDVTLTQLHFLKRQSLAFLPAMSVGIGVRLTNSSLYNGTKYDTYMTMPLGVEVKYQFPIEEVNAYAGASVYFAPEVLSFYQARNYKEFNAYTALELIPTVEMKVGYRSIDFNYTQNINRTAYAGLSFDF